MANLMVDLETLAVSPNSVVLTLGAVKFEYLGKGVTDQLYIKFSLEDQEKLGREIDPNTLDWWSKQDPLILEEALNETNRISLVDGINQFHKFAWGCKTFWSHGATFDLVIIESLYSQIKKSLPWNFWQLRDTRTLFDLGHDPEMPQGNKHNALEDAIRQTIGVQNVYSKLKIMEK